ncbi:general stress protein [Actinomyces trachealis]|uniref:general stress protein n=1 Tax=Actinomyces trachealis TaxID=2763540 RepID=UPI001892C7E6|nr:general stress protein [Actinomyces trachealis]
MSQFPSSLGPNGLSNRADTGVPVGEEAASFATYAEAQFAVDSLSDAGFPVQHLTIVGTDLRQVERITGRMSWGRAAAAGAGSGLWLGMFFAAMMALFNPEGASTALFMGCVLLGVVWGILFQLAGYALSRGKRDFTSISQVVASRYSILATEHAREAAQGLAQVPGNLLRGGQAAKRAEERRRARTNNGEAVPSAFGSRPDEKPRFGVRIDDVAPSATTADAPPALPLGTAPGAAPEVLVPDAPAPVLPADEAAKASGTTVAGATPVVGSAGKTKSDSPDLDDPYRRR